MLSSPIEEIKNRLDIVQVISGYIKLQKAGANFRALCPFHSEKKPSFFVSPARQIWHCFGCSVGGDIFKFIMRIEGVEFGDALRILAQKAGIELKKEDPKLKSERQRFYEICELSCRFFEKQLESSKAGQEAKNYLLNRGITEESLKKWRVGYAPDTWQGLSDFLVGRGHKREEVERVGLVIKKEDGSWYDRFRSRIIFPIFDLNSQVVSFGGRIFGQKEEKEIAKYVNTPNTLLYDKSRILYGLDKAKMAIRKKNECILVEGYTDVILNQQAGFENAVAVSGTALTPYQLKILKRYSDNLLTGFDMDVAGDSATKRGIDLAQILGFNIKVITMPESLDPADIISRNLKEWEELINKAKSILKFYFETTLAKFDKKTVEGKKDISKILLPVIKKIPNRIEQSFWVQQLSKELEIKEEDAAEELKKIKIEPGHSSDLESPEEKENSQPLPKTRKELLEERLAALIVKFPEELGQIAKEDLNFFSPKISQVCFHLKNNSFPVSVVAAATVSPEITDFINYLSFKAEALALDDEIFSSVPAARKEIKCCLKEIKTLEIKNKLNQISQSIKKAEEEKDLPKIQELLGEFNHYSKLRNDLELKCD